MHHNPNIVEQLSDLTVHEQKNLIATLRGLHTTMRDAAAGYALAKEKVSDPSLREVLEETAAERAAAEKELEELLGRFGYAADDDPPSVSGELHRGWIALRSALSNGAPSDILGECERGEHAALHRYERALETKLPLEIANVLLDQAESVRNTRAAFDRMRHPW
jgi:uncharacterized protein (TIGR02284 family)